MFLFIVMFTKFKKVLLCTRDPDFAFGIVFSLFFLSLFFFSFISL